MHVTFNLPDDIGVEIKRLPNADEFATEALREKMERYRKDEAQQKRDEAFQDILDFTPMESTELSEETVRKEREKRDTRNFRETVLARAKRDDAFRVALLMEAVDPLLEGDVEIAKRLLRDYIHVSISMDELSKRIHTKKENIQRMLGPNGNPGIKSIFPIIKVLQEYEGIKITATRG